jgi:hypothetical protein
MGPFPEDKQSPRSAQGRISGRDDIRPQKLLRQVEGYGCAVMAPGLRHPLSGFSKALRTSAGVAPPLSQTAWELGLILDTISAS